MEPGALQTGQSAVPAPAARTGDETPVGPSCGTGVSSSGSARSCSGSGQPWRCPEPAPACRPAVAEGAAPQAAATEPLRGGEEGGGRVPPRGRGCRHVRATPARWMGWALRSRCGWHAAAGREASGLETRDWKLWRCVGRGGGRAPWRERFPARFSLVDRLIPLPASSAVSATSYRSTMRTTPPRVRQTPARSSRSCQTRGAFRPNVGAAERWMRSSVGCVGAA